MTFFCLFYFFSGSKLNNLTVLTLWSVDIGATITSLTVFWTNIWKHCVPFIVMALENHSSFATLKMLFSNAVKQKLNMSMRFNICPDTGLWRFVFAVFRFTVYQSNHRGLSPSYEIGGKVIRKTAWKHYGKTYQDF